MLSIVTHAEGRRTSLERLLSVTARMRPRPFEVVADVRDAPAARGDGRAGLSRPASERPLGAGGAQPVPPERFRSAAFAVRRGVLDHIARVDPDRQDGHGDDLGHAAARAGVPIWLWPTALVQRQATTRERAPT